MSSPVATPEELRRKLPSRAPGRFLIVLLAPIALLSLACALLAALAAPRPSPPCAGMGCAPNPPEPIGVADGATPRATTSAHAYTSSRFGFHVQYFSSWPIIGEVPVQAAAGAATLVLSYPDPPIGPAWIVFGASAEASLSARAVVADVVAGSLPGAEIAYRLPGASVGYQPGAGAVYDYTPDSANGTASTERVVVICALKHHLAIVAIAAGPYVRFTASYPGINFPVAVDSFAGLLLNDPLNTVRWPGDPPR